MEIFTLLFPSGMIAFPAVFATVWPARLALREEPARLQMISRLKRRLWLATGATLAASWVLHAGIGIELAAYAWVAVFPLWFALAMPLLAAKDPGWRPAELGSVRRAALKRRDVVSLRWQAAWLGAGLLWLLLLAATVAGMLREGGASWMLFFSVVAGFELGLFHWAMRRSLMEPEQRASWESQEVARARESLRNLKLWGWFGVATLAMVAFSLPPLVLSWFGDEALNLAIGLGVGGGVAGGGAGSVVGVMADVYRTRINREINVQTDGGSGTSVAR